MMCVAGRRYSAKKNYDKKNLFNAVHVGRTSVAAASINAACPFINRLQQEGEKQGGNPVLT